MLRLSSLARLKLQTTPTLVIDMAALDITRPDGMSEALYKAIYADYGRAQARHGMSVTRTAAQRTIDKNEKLQHEAKVVLAEAVKAFKANADLRGLINSGNTSSSQALTLLRACAETQTSRHNEIMDALRALQGSSSSSSSAPPQPAVIEAMDLDLPDCIICTDSCSDGVIMPCCTRPQSDKVCCKTCFIASMTSSSGAVTCPACRGNISELPEFPQFPELPEFPKFLELPEFP